MRPRDRGAPRGIKTLPRRRTAGEDEGGSLAAFEAVDMTQHARTAALRMYLDLPPRHSSRGPRYTVRLGSPAGEVIITDRLTPLYDATRVLLVRGNKGRIELWDAERPYPRMVGDIANLAKLAIREDECTSPKIVRWSPFAVAREEPKTADLSSPATHHHPEIRSAAGGAGVRLYEARGLIDQAFE